MRDLYRSPRPIEDVDKVALDTVSCMYDEPKPSCCKFL